MERMKTRLPRVYELRTFSPIEGIDTTEIHSVHDPVDGLQMEAEEKNARMISLQNQSNAL